MVRCIKISLLCCILFSLLGCGSSPKPEEAACGVEFPPISFKPRFTVDMLPLQVIPYPQMTESALSEALSFWEDIANRSLFTGAVRPFSIDFRVLSMMAYPAVASDRPDGCTILFQKEEYINNIFILKHEIGHCLGFSHSAASICCIMTGGAIGTIQPGDCDLTQLTTYVNE